MAVEIEYKYLVADDGWRDEVTSTTAIRQGYLAVTDACSVRIRMKGDAAFLTVKSPREGATRTEYEYPVPVADAEGLMALCADRVVSKTRYEVRVGGVTFEVDEFAGRNEGLLLAELEVSGQDIPVLPNWIGDEVTDDDRYYSAHLSRHPFSEW